MITSVTAELDGIDGPEVGYFVSLAGLGVPVWNKFTAQVMAGIRDVNRVSFTLGGRTETDSNASDGWTAQFDMSELQPGRQKLEVVAYDQQDLASPTFTVSVYVISKPVWYDQPWVLHSRVTWSTSAKQYTFTCHLPNNPALRFEKDISFQYLGSLRNVFASDISLTEVFKLAGEWSFSAKGTLEATILGASMFSEEYTLTPELERSADDPWYRLKALRFESPEFELPGYNKNIVDDKTIATFYVLGIKFDVKLSVDIGYEANLKIKGRVLSDLTVDEIRTIPSVSPYVQVDIALDILFGVATVGSQIKPTLTFYLPIVYDSTPPLGKSALYLDTPCVHFLLRAKLYVKLFWGAGEWDSGWYDMAQTDWPEGCAKNQAIAVVQEPPVSLPPDHFIAPALATDDTGRALALWVHDEEPLPGQANPELYYALGEGGKWGAPLRLTTDDYWQSDPQVIFLSTGQALAVWTQNTLDRTEVITNLNQILNAQELYYAVSAGLVEGTFTWSEPAPITNDALPDGRVALAASTARQALAVWVHDEDGQVETRGDWEIYFALWNGSSWNSPAPIASDQETADLEPFVAYDREGKAIAVWVRDLDSDPMTIDDRRLAYARWNGDAWSEAVIPSDWPPGVLWPSVGFDNDNRAVVVFTARGRDALGQLYGEGLQDLLWSARMRNDSWELVSIGEATIADRPRVLVNADNYALVFYRGFTADGPGGYAGDIAVAVANLNEPILEWGPPGFLTTDPARDWQLAAAVEAGTGGTLVLDVRESTAQATALHIAGAMQGLDEMLAISIPFGADLAIADLSFSDAHPDAGEIVFITATVQNLAFADVPAGGNVVVRFFVDSATDPDKRIGEAVMNARLGYNGKHEVAIPWIASAGRHEIIAVVDAEEQVRELKEDNNQAMRTVGEVAAPRFLLAATDPIGGRVLLQWEPSATVGVAYYRIYRSTVPGGPYELVGTSSETVYADDGLVNGQIYYYTITAVDAAGTASPRSNEVSAIPQRTIRYYVRLPVILKQ